MKNIPNLLNKKICIALSGKLIYNTVVRKIIERIDIMKVKVNQDCIGCGLCISMYPELFEYNDEGLSRAKSEEVSDSLKNDIAEAQATCPVGAIEAQ